MSFLRAAECTGPKAPAGVDGATYLAGAIQGRAEGPPNFSQPSASAGEARSPPDPQKQGGRREGHTDAEADMVSAEASTAICVQRFDDSRNSAIHITYRISLRSSSLREPRYPLLRVVFV